MMRALGIVSLALAFALATWLFGWIAAPVLAAAFGATAGRERAPLEAVGAVLLAWSAVLVVQATRGSVADAASLLGGVIGIPAWTIVLATLAFGIALAWSAAVVGRELGRAVRARRGRRVATSAS